ncbi:MAG: TonB-dependent receptor plug domain-containing protein [Ferruginibacter sp.]
MKRTCTYFFIVVCNMLAPCTIGAQVTDTLTEVKVFSKKPLDITTSPVPIQQLNKKALSKLNSISVADAVRYLPGVLVKDYGGIGGLKTVSVRSLGANHTGIMYDGVIIADAQGGQIDLGRFSLDNIESIQLFSNQPTDILLPARGYASASVIALSSSSSGNERAKATFGLKMKAGSFGFINPSLYYKAQVNKNFSTGLFAEYQGAKGDYSFVDYETGNSKTRRINSDIRSYKLEYDAAYAANDSNQVRFKAYYYNSKRGLPGGVILYNGLSNERLNNESFFTQLSWHKDFSQKSRILLNVKYASDRKYYIDPSYLNYAGKLENEFHQQEFYLSAAYSYKVAPSLAVSYSIDYFKDKLKRTDSFALAFANPDRDNLLNNIAVQWKLKRLELTGNLLHTYVNGKVETGPTANALHALRGAIAASVQPFNNIPFRIRASMKSIFRVPTFDDLYYTNIGNTNLRPENAKLYDFGLTFNSSIKGYVNEIIITADGYYNKVTDKILAVPRQNLFQWTMLNIASVDTKGVDAALQFVFEKVKGVLISSRLSYTYQRALDISDPASASYKRQIPYTPEHSGSINTQVNYRKFTVSYNVIASSYRYRLGVQTQENLVKGWTTHDLSIGYGFASKKYWDYKVLAELNNVFNQQYEIIKFYPMPRLNYRVGVVASFKKNK